MTTFTALRPLIRGRRVRFARGSLSRRRARPVVRRRAQKPTTTRAHTRLAAPRSPAGGLVPLPAAAIHSGGFAVISSSYNSNRPTDQSATTLESLLPDTGRLLGPALNYQRLLNRYTRVATIQVTFQSGLLTFTEAPNDSF